MRQTLGTAVFTGMLGVTLFGLFFTPVFYVVMRWVGRLGRKAQAGAAGGGAADRRSSHRRKPPRGLFGAGHDHWSRSLTEPTAAGAMVGGRHA